MNPRKYLKNSLFRKVARFFIHEIIALLISIIIIIIMILALFTYHVESVIYGSNPLLLGEDDLGGGMMMAGAVIGSLFFSLPLAVLIHIFIFRKFFMRGEKR
jgi:hypothetical protein